VTQPSLRSLLARLGKLGGIATFVGMVVWVAGCDDDVPPAQSGRGMSGGGTKPNPSATASAAPSIEQSKLVLRDEDFVESERNRDPFRSFNLMPGPKGVPEAMLDPQRPVVMPETNVEEMKLIAVVLGLNRPKAMLTSPDGVGHVVQRGDYLGKAKVLQATGSVPMTLNWRVDRIREHEVVLTRQDPTDVSRTPMSRVITMID
jgi:type IV pilus assembly protein PilP